MPRVRGKLHMHALFKQHLISTFLFGPRIEQVPLHGHDLSYLPSRELQRMTVDSPMMESWRLPNNARIRHVDLRL